LIVGWPTVTPLRATMLINAPEGAVRRVIGRTDVWTRTAHAMGGRAEVAGPRTGPLAPLRDGDLIRVRARPSSLPAGRPGWPSLVGSRSLILRVTRAGSDHDRADPAGQRLPVLPSLTLVAGPLRSCAVTITTAPTAAGTLVTVDCRVVATTALRTSMLRRRVLRAAQLFLGIATLAALEVQVVVAGAVIQDGRVLAARRTGPRELAGFWELPGGKVDPGESEPQALARELAEELGVKVDIGGRIGPDVDLGDNMVLRCYRAASNDSNLTADLAPVEHDEVRWLAADELDSVPWVTADSSLVQTLGSELER